MKKLFTKKIILGLFSLFAYNAFAQTVLINPATDGAFEGASFAADNWLVLNNATNNVWVESTGATAGFTGAQCAYITNNAAGTPPPHAYTNSASRVSALYRDITVPAGETTILLSFKWVNLGETGYDRLQVWAVPTSYTPLNGTASMTTTGSAPTGRVQLGTGATGYVGSSTWATANITIPAAYAGTSFRLVFQWRNDGSGGSNPPIAIDDVSLVSSCSGAATAAATAIGTTTATLNAAAFAGATGYNFRYRIVGAPSWTNAAGNPYAGTSAAITGLTPGTSYEFQVAAAGPVCNVWSSSGTFTTLCTAITSLPWTEGFEGVGTVAAGVFPNCWSYVNVTGTNSPGTYATTDTYRGPRTGSKQAYTQYSTTAWTFTPAFTLTAGVSYDFSFYMMNKSVTSPVDFLMDVAYGTSASAAGMTNVLQTAYVPTNSTYSQFKYTFTPLTSGDYYFGYQSTSTSFTPWYLSFDDFKLELSPACISPTATSATNVTSTSADYNFTCSSCSGNYIVEYGLNGFTPGTGATAGAGGTVITTSTLTGTISGLSALTGYQYYVRQICAGPTYSSNAGPVSFTTSLDCSTAPAVTCGTPFSFSVAAGTGTWNTTPTGICVVTPGKEMLFSFTPAQTGTYNLSNTVAGTGDFVDAYVKPAAGGCSDAASWTCVGWYLSSLQNRSLGTLTAGTEYYIMADVETATASTQTFNIACLLPPPANDECAAAVSLTVNPDFNCGTTTAGTLGGATASSGPTSSCGTFDDDVWYKFVATNTTHQVLITHVSGSTSDYSFQVLNACGAASALVCSDPESASVTGLTVGATYYVRVASYTSTGSQTSNFTVCIGTPPPPPANDECATSTTLTVNPDLNCGATSPGTLVSATASSGPTSSCGTFDDDVWYTFVATNTTHQVVITHVSGSTSDYSFQVLNACGAASALVCSDPETASVTGLTIGATYYVRVASYTATTGQTSVFTVCVGTPPPPPANDNCPGAIAFPTIPTDGSCASVTVNTASATGTADATCGGTEDDDVWYTFTVPAGKTSVNYVNTSIGGTSSDRMIQVLTACGGTNVGCYDPENGTITGLTGGTTYILRTYSYGSGDYSNYSICLSVTPPPPANDNCATAKPLVSCGAQDSIAKLGGATQSIAAISCASFTGTANDDVWYSFVADATTMYITVKGYGGYDAVVDLRSGGCNGTNISCADASVSDQFEDIVATGLTIGSTYYVRVYDYGSTSLAATTGFWIQVGPAGCWQGANSSAWSDGGNWSNGLVPNSCATNVIIPAGTPNAPAVTAATYSVGNVNIASGVNLTLTGNDLNVCGNWAAGTGANAVTVGTGKVVLQGTGAQTITGNTKFESLTVNSGAGSYTNSGTVQIAKLYTPQSGTFTNSGTLRFLSTSATAIATIDLTPANSGTISGSIIAERFVPVAGTNQHYVSSPVDAPSLSAQFGATGTPGFVVPLPNCDETQLYYASPYGTVFRYNENNGNSCSLRGWEVLTSGNADNGRGYSVYLPGTTSTPWSLSGSANMGSNYSLSGLTNSNWTNTTLQGRTQNSGWTLVGNPYLSTINLTAKTGLDAQAQVWQTSGPYTGTYQPVIMGAGSAFVAPFQGFMVHKTTTGGSASFSVGRPECVNSTTTFYKTGSSNGTLSLKVSGNGYNDVTTITFDELATNQFDVDRDANKLPGNLVQPMIASKVNSDIYSINTLNSIATNPTVDVEFMAGKNGGFTITADDLSTFDPTVMVYLEDKVTNAPWIDLRTTNTYTFTGNVADTKERFALHFTPAAFVDTKDAECDKGGAIIMNQEGSEKWTVEVKNAGTNVVAAHTQPLSKATPIVFENMPIGSYDLVLTNRAGYVVTKTVTIGGTSALVAHYTATTNTPTVNQSVGFASTSNQTATYSWNFGDGSTSNVANPSHVYSTAGAYTVVLKATNTEGCETTVSQTITVLDVTGIGNVNSTSKDISVYVNSEKNLNITFSGYKGEMANIQVFNIIGQEILNVKHNTGTKFVHEIDQVEAAYLIVKIAISGQTTTKKVLITKE